MYVCICRAVTDHAIKRAIAEGASEIEEIARLTGAGTCCGSCIPAIGELLGTPASDSPHVIPCGRPCATCPSRLPLVHTPSKPGEES